MHISKAVASFIPVPSVVSLFTLGIALMFKLTRLLVALSFLALIGCDYRQESDTLPNPYDLNKSVVKLTPYPLMEAFGSGVVVDMTNEAETCKVTVATAEHVANYSKTMYVDGKQESYLTVLHPKQDIALVIVKYEQPCHTLPYKTAKLSTFTPQPLDTVIHIGYPAGMYQIARGTFVGWNMLMGYDIDVETITSVAGPGSSGGAVFNTSGELVGILVMTEARQPFRNFYTPVKYLFDLTSNLNRKVV